MWIFLSNGFISAVEDRNDETGLIVRGRTREHPAGIFPEQQDQIEYTPTGDYHYRLRMTKAQLANIVSEKILNIGYDNFKNSIKERRYHDAAFETWAAMNRLQQQVERDTGPDRH